MAPVFELLPPLPLFLPPTPSLSYLHLYSSFSLLPPPSLRLSFPLPPLSFLPASLPTRCLIAKGCPMSFIVVCGAGLTYKTIMNSRPSTCASLHLTSSEMTCALTLFTTSELKHQVRGKGLISVSYTHYIYITSFYRMGLRVSCPSTFLCITKYITCMYIFQATPSVFREII